MSHISLEVNLGKLRLKNPIIIASGILSRSLLINAIVDGASAVTTKTLTLNPREGYPPPNLVKLPYGFINAYGWKNPGVKKFVEEDLREIISRAREFNSYVIGSAGGFSLNEYVKVASLLEEGGVDAVEIDIACPTIDKVLDTSFDLKYFTDVVKNVKSVLKVPLIVKLHPSYINIGKVAKLAVDAGADIISAINTVAPAIAIDIDSGKPLLGNPKGVGGLSGPAIKPIALAKVLEIAMEVDVPVIGIGGITTWKDVIEMIMVGADAVGMVSAIFIHKGTSFIKNLLDGIKNFMAKKGYKSIQDFKGLTIKYISK